MSSPELDEDGAIGAEFVNDECEVCQRWIEEGRQREDAADAISAKR